MRTKETILWWYMRNYLDVLLQGVGLTGVIEVRKLSVKTNSSHLGTMRNSTVGRENLIDVAIVGS